jgi:hypothetical protein
MEVQAETRDIKPRTIKSHKQHIKRVLREQTDIFDPIETTKAILKMKGLKEQKLCKSYIDRILISYSLFCEANFPIRQAKTQIRNTNSHNSKNTTSTSNNKQRKTRQRSHIFTILRQTAIEQEELHSTPITQVDKEQGIISVNGLKGHANGVYKLKSQTADMLRIYLSKRIGKQYPFPKPKSISENWRNARKRAAQKLCEPELNQIPLKNLRNYAGAIFYKTTGRHDPIATMRFMRHKHLETTLHYIRSINLDEPEEYITVSIQLGQPDTAKQIIEYSNAGYDKLTEADGYLYMRIRK